MNDLPAKNTLDLKDARWHPFLRIVIRMIWCNTYCTVKKNNIVDWVQCHLKVAKVKGGSEATAENCFKLKNIASCVVYENFIVTLGRHNHPARFQVVWSVNFKLRVFFASHIVAQWALIAPQNWQQCPHQLLSVFWYHEFAWTAIEWLGLVVRVATSYKVQ